MYISRPPQTPLVGNSVLVRTVSFFNRFFKKRYQNAQETKLLHLSWDPKLFETSPLYSPPLLVQKSQIFEVRQAHPRMILVRVTPPGNKFRHCLGMLGVGVPVPCKNERNLILGQRNDHTLSFLPVFASFNLPDTTGCFLNIKYHV